MKKLIFTFIITSSFILCSCNSNQPNKSTPASSCSITNDDGVSIELYMSRDDAEKILGYGEQDDRGIYEYADISIGYTQDKVSYIETYSGYWSLADNNSVGHAVENPDNYIFIDTNNPTYLKLLKKDGSEYISTTKESHPAKWTVDNYGAFQGIQLSTYDSKIDIISIYDTYASFTLDFD